MDKNKKDVSAATFTFDQLAKNEMATIVEEGGGGGSGLPDVTDADNGAVLGVVNGEWDKVDKSPLIVTYTISSNDNYPYPLTFDHTLSEISAAYEAGREVLAKIAIPGLTTFYAPFIVRPIDSSFPLAMASVTSLVTNQGAIGTGIILHTIDINDEETVDVAVLHQSVINTSPYFFVYDSETNTLAITD